MKLTKENITKVMSENNEYDFFGLRHDEHAYSIGEEVSNSHQWYQDDPAAWGEDLPYIEELRLWDGGELGGTCAVSIDGVDGIEKAMKAANKYDGSHLYLIASHEAWGGNDYGEVIMPDAVVVAEFE